MTCKHQLVMNTVYYVERVLKERMEKVPPEEELVLVLDTKPEKKPSTLEDHQKEVDQVRHAPEHFPRVTPLSEGDKLFQAGLDFKRYLSRWLFMLALLCVYFTT